MRKKIAILLLALCATATVNAQTGPMKVSKYNQATKAADICGIYYWGYKYLEAQPTSNSDAASSNTNLKSGSAYVAITLLNEEDNTVQIWRMFEKPLTATFNSNKGLTIQTGQVIETNSNGEDIVLKAAGFSGTTYNNSYSSFSYSVYSTYYYYTAYWLDPVNSVTGENTGKYYAVSAASYGGTTQNNYLQSANAYPDNTYNAIMNLKYDKTVSPGRADQTYIVQVTQNGNTVSVQNFLGGGKTVNINLHADGTFDIPQQVAYTNSSNVDYYTWAGDYSEGTFKATSRTIEGTGTENELNLGNFLIMTTEGSSTGAFASAKIILTRNSDNSLREFRYPVALTMTDAQWASISSEKALDFTGTDLTPYAVSEVDATNGATLSPVEVAVAPHTGLFVSGVAGNYEIPTVAEGNALPANALVATSQGDHTSDGQTYWGLGLDANSGEIGLKKMSAGSVAANKAYLIFDRAAAGAKSFLPFNFGGTTAIEGSLTPNPSPEGKGSLYNLQGQRVGEGYRGIVIKNGKKVVIR